MKTKFAFVNTGSSAEAALAMSSLQGAEFYGGCLVINFAKDRQQTDNSTLPQYNTNGPYSINGQYNVSSQYNNNNSYFELPAGGLPPQAQPQMLTHNPAAWIMPQPISHEQQPQQQYMVAVQPISHEQQQYMVAAQPIRHEQQPQQQYMAAAQPIKHEQQQQQQ